MHHGGTANATAGILLCALSNNESGFALDAENHMSVQRNHAVYFSTRKYTVNDFLT